MTFRCLGDDELFICFAIADDPARKPQTKRQANIVGNTQSAAALPLVHSNSLVIGHNGGYEYGTGRGAGTRLADLLCGANAPRRIPELPAARGSQQPRL
jgi:hypothetical protein